MENGRKLCKWVENTVGKGEIARYEQFLLFPQCFQKACFPGVSKGVIVWEWVNKTFKTPGLLSLTHQQQTGFESIVGKGEIARNEQFLLFPQCFILKQLIVSPFVHIFAITSLFAAELEEPKICI